jgi:putative hydrolase of the HAD superfamily
MGAKNSVHNVIFDLGGVFLDLDFTLTISALQKLLGVEVYSRNHQYEFIDQFEMGQISAEEFRSELKTLASASSGKSTLSDPEIDRAWNAMLGALPKERLDWLQELSAKKRVFLLSNTNEIHKSAFDQIAQNTIGSIKAFDDLFEGAYYSHLIGLRKPSPEVYKYIVDRHGLDPHHTLFVDDTYSNLIGAEVAGLMVKHLTDDVTKLTFN